MYRQVREAVPATLGVTVRQSLGGPLSRRVCVCGGGGGIKRGVHCTDSQRQGRTVQIKKEGLDRFTGGLGAVQREGGRGGRGVVHCTGEGWLYRWTVQRACTSGLYIGAVQRGCTSGLYRGRTVHSPAGQRGLERAGRPVRRSVRLHQVFVLGVVPQPLLTTNTNTQTRPHKKI